MFQDVNVGIPRSLEEGSEVLERIREAFERMLAHEDVKAYSFVEEIPTTRVGMVRVLLPPIHLQIIMNCGLVARAGSQEIFWTDWECIGGQGVYTCHPQRDEQVQQCSGDWLQAGSRSDRGFCCRSEGGGGEQETSEVYPGHW